VVVGDSLYVVAFDSLARTCVVLRVPLDGGAATKLVGGMPYLSGIASDGEFLYLSTIDDLASRTPTSTIVRLALDGSASLTLVAMGGPIWSPTVVGGTVFFGGGPLGAGFVRSVPTSGAAVQATSVAEGQTAGVGSVFVDADYVYWADDKHVMRRRR
jgi:hypothetical protein